MIGDPVADYLDAYEQAAGPLRWREPADVPGEVRERLDGLYVEGLQRKPTDTDLRALFDFMHRSR